MLKSAVGQQSSMGIAKTIPRAIRNGRPKSAAVGRPRVDLEVQSVLVGPFEQGMHAINIQRLDPRHDGEPVALREVQSLARRNFDRRTDSIKRKCAAKLAFYEGDICQRRRIAADKVIAVIFPGPEGRQARWKLFLSGTEASQIFSLGAGHGCHCNHQGKDDGVDLHKVLDGLWNTVLRNCMGWPLGSGVTVTVRWFQQ